MKTDVERVIQLAEAKARIEEKLSDAENVVMRRAGALAKAMNTGKMSYRPGYVFLPTYDLKMTVEGDMLTIAGWRYRGDCPEQESFSMPLDYANGQNDDLVEARKRIAEEEARRAKLKAEQEEQRRQTARRAEYEKLKKEFGD